MSSFDRLLDLAQQTGSKLIVHDPIEGRDLAILSIDEFERMVLGGKSVDFDPRNLSSSEMLDKINRDISVWRARQEEDEEWGKEMLLDEELGEESPFDPFKELDSHTSSWHSAGSVLENRYGGNLDDLGENEDEEDAEEGIGNDEIKIEDLPFGPEEETLRQAQGKEKTTPILLAKNSEEGGWKEELLLEEEPIFYEEPV